MNKKFEVNYDQKNDILYFAREGEEEKFIEVFPGINIELNENKELIGIEILEASKILKDVVKPLQEKQRRSSSFNLSS